MKLTTTLFIMLLSLMASAQSQQVNFVSMSKIRIDFDQDACMYTFGTIPVAVIVNSERHEFEPNCTMDFEDEFKLKTGIRCRIEAGMCSNLPPYNRIDVFCEDKSMGSADVECP